MHASKLVRGSQVCLIAGLGGENCLLWRSKKSVGRGPLVTMTVWASYSVRRVEMCWVCSSFIHVRYYYSIGTSRAHSLLAPHLAAWK